MLKRVFFARDDQVLDKYNEIWGVIKKRYINFIASLFMVKNT